MMLGGVMLAVRESCNDLQPLMCKEAYPGMGCSRLVDEINRTSIKIHGGPGQTEDGVLFNPNRLVGLHS
jgi:hypothetical protein